MFGNNYSNPYGYGSYQNPGYNQYSQPYFNNMNMPTSSDAPMQGVKFVTQDEAKAFMVMPNQRVMLMDKNNSLFYIKSADSLGQSSLEAYEFKKINLDEAQNPKKEEPKLDIENLVKRNELDNLVKKDEFSEELKVVKIDLAQKIEELKKSINIKKYLEGEIKDV